MTCFLIMFILVGLGGIGGTGAPHLSSLLLQGLTKLALQVLVFSLDFFILYPQRLVVLLRASNFSSKVMLEALMLKRGKNSQTCCGTVVLSGTGWPCLNSGFWVKVEVWLEKRRHGRAPWHGGAVLMFCPVEKCKVRIWLFLWRKCVWVFGRVLDSKLRPGEALALIPNMMHPQGNNQGRWENHKPQEWKGRKASFKITNSN